MINERIGEFGGDSAIAHVADCIRSEVKDHMGVCGVYRFVGAEIAVLTRYVDERRIWTLAESIRERIACTPIRITGRSGQGEFLGLKSTIGISLFTSAEDPSNSATPDQLLGSAMCAVTEGRRSGGNQVVMYDKRGYIDSRSRTA